MCLTKNPRLCQNFFWGRNEENVPGKLGRATPDKILVFELENLQNSASFVVCMEKQLNPRGKLPFLIAIQMCLWL
jgi:hypothetical protein